MSPCAFRPARYWWLSSVNPSNANNVRNVNTSGSLDNNNANNSNGVVPRLWESERQVSTITPNAKHPHREPHPAFPFPL